MKILSPIFISLLFVFFIQSCSHSAHSNQQKTYPSGIITVDALLANHKDFADNFNLFELSSLDVTKIKQWPANLSIEVFFGVWCHDSQREVPRLIKILQQNPNVSASYIALNTKKNDPQHLAQQAQVKYTPTIIVSLSGKEVGRIIERPKYSLIADIERMLGR